MAGRERGQLMRSFIATAVLLCMGLSGCSMTGIDAQKSFSCKAPPGIGCSSLSGVYANAVADNLPDSSTRSATVYGKKDQGKSTIVGEAPATGAPLLSVPTVLRVWIAPWEDSRKVLHDQSFLYAVADPGHWQVAHSRKKIAEQYRVLMPAAKQAQQPESQPAQPQYQMTQPQQPQTAN